MRFSIFNLNNNTACRGGSRISSYRGRELLDNEGKWYKYATLFEMIFWNRETFGNKVVACIPKRVLTSENILKTRSLKHAF